MVFEVATYFTCFLQRTTNSLCDWYYIALLKFNCFFQWATFLDSEGRVVDSKALRKRIFYGGVEHKLRKEVCICTKQGILSGSILLIKNAS